MVVNKTTAVLYLIALSLSGFIHTFLRAEERGIYDDVFTADELHHYRINERGGRTGSLAVSGALLSSPCTLVSNEVPLSLRPENHSASAGAPLMLRLAGCGDGGALLTGGRRRCWPPGGKGRHRRVSILMPGAIRPCCV